MADNDGKTRELNPDDLPDAQRALDELAAAAAFATAKTAPLHPHGARFDRRKQAEAQVEKARALISNGGVTVGRAQLHLREAVDSLDGDFETEADHIRQEICQLWRSLTEITKDADAAYVFLEEGVKRFKGYPEAQPLTDALRLAEAGRQVQVALADLPGVPYPAWLDHPEAPQRLARLLQVIQTLHSPAAWPALQERARASRAALMERILPARLRSGLAGARKAAARLDFPTALETVDDALRLIPPGGGTGSGAGLVVQEELSDLRRALLARLEAERFFHVAAQELVTFTARRPPAITAAQLDAFRLPDHPDVPVNDLKHMQGLCAPMLDTARMLSAPLGAENYAWRIYQLNQLAARLDSSPAASFAFLDRDGKALAERFQHRLNELRQSLTRSAADAAQGLPELLHMAMLFLRSPQDARAALRLVWQIHWCRQSGLLPQETDQQTTQALADINTALHRHLEAAARSFASWQEWEALGDLEQTLRTLALLNSGLAAYSDNLGEAGTVFHLPPLPEQASLPAFTPLYDPAALEGWIEVIAVWQQSAYVPGTGELGRRAPGWRLARLSDHLDVLLKGALRLRDELWPRLGLAAWEAGHTPMALLEALPGFRRRVAELADWLATLPNLPPAEVFRGVERLVLANDSVDLSPDLAALLQPLTNDYAETQQELIDWLRSWLATRIGEILNQSGQPARLLQSEIINLPRTPASAGLAIEMLAQALELDAAQKSRQVNDRRRLALQALQGWLASPPTVDPAVYHAWEALAERLTPRQRLTLPAITLPPLRLPANAGWIALAFIGLVVVGVLARGLFGLAADLPQQISGLPAAGGPALSSPETPPVQSGGSLPASETPAAAAVGFDSATPTASPTPVTPAALPTESPTATPQPSRTGTPTRTSTPSALPSAMPTASLAANLAAATLGARQTAVQATRLADLAAATQNAAATAAAARTATAQAVQDTQACTRAETYTYLLSGSPELTPQRNTLYVRGNVPYSASAGWTITNTSPCAWDNVTVSNLLGIRDTPVTFLRGGVEASVNSQNPVLPGEAFTLVIQLGNLTTESVSQEWVLVVNGLGLLDQPRLELDVRNWLRIVTPTPARTRRPTPRPTSTPRPTATDAPPTREPPPTAAPTRGPGTTR